MAQRCLEGKLWVSNFSLGTIGVYDATTGGD
jgi:hypothetical protein